MGYLDGMTFDQAMQHVAHVRNYGAVGISVFHKHEYDRIEADEGCYAVHWYSPEELTKARIEAEKPEDPLPQFEAQRNHLGEDGLWHGDIFAEAETLTGLFDEIAEILEAQEQNKNGS